MIKPQCGQSIVSVYCNNTYTEKKVYKHRIYGKVNIEA